MQKFGFFFKEDTRRGGVWLTLCRGHQVGKHTGKCKKANYSNTWLLQTSSSPVSQEGRASVRNFLSWRFSPLEALDWHRYPGCSGIETGVPKMHEKDYDLNVPLHCSTEWLGIEMRNTSEEIEWSAGERMERKGGGRILLLRCFSVKRQEFFSVDSQGTSNCQTGSRRIKDS